MRPFRILISAGEVSGDQRAASVVKELRSLAPHTLLRGMGGDTLRREGVETIIDSNDAASVMGVRELLGSARKILHAFTTLSRELNEWKPDLLFLIDFPDFNLRLAKRAKRLGIPVYYYIPPKVWAWRAWRVRALDRFVDRVASIFPFEEEFHRSHGYCRTRYVGHPFLDELHPESSPRAHLLQKLGLDPERKTLAIFPGSRNEELRRHLPIVRELYDILKESHKDLQIILTVPSERVKMEVVRFFPHSSQCVVTVGNSLEVLQAADVGVLKSGTCNLEAAFFALPFICFYKGSALSAYIVRQFLHIREVSLVNIIRPGTVPEFLQEQARPELMAKEVEMILSVDSVRREYKERLSRVVEDLRQSHAGEGGTTSLAVARELLSFYGPTHA